MDVKKLLLAYFFIPEVTSWTVSDLVFFGVDYNDWYPFPF